MPQPDTLAIAWRYIDDDEYQNDSIRTAIEESDLLYFGRAPQPPAESTGRSAAVSMDVQSVITATQASILDGLTGAQPAAFEATGDQDDLQAELESKAVTDQIFRGDGFLQLSGAIENSLRYQLCAMRAFVETKTTTEKRTLPDATAEELATLQGAIPEDFDPVISGDTVSWQRQTEELVKENIDIARLRYPKDHPSMDVQSMPFIAIQHRDLRADMLDMGFPAAIVDKLPRDNQQSDSNQVAIRSKLVAQERSFNDAPDPALDYIEWFECWLKAPQGDGTTELIRLATAERERLDESPATHVPIVLGAAYPEPHRAQGISMAAKVQPTQVQKSELLRQALDNTEATNNPRSLTYDIDLSDAQNGRINGLLRASSPNARYEPIPVQDLTSGVLGMIGYLDQVRSEVGGSALDMQQPESELMKSQVGAVTSQQMLGNQELSSAFIARNLGETLIAGLYKLIHRVLREDFTGTLQVRRADQAMQVQPRDWQPRETVILTAGMSPMARNRKAANLMQVIQTQMALMQSGAPLTDMNGLHAALRDWALASDLGSINKYLTDPDSEKGQQMAQQAAQQAQEQQQLQQGMAQVQIQLEQGKLAMEKYKADLDAQVDIFTERLKAELKEAELTLQGISDAEKADIDRAQGQSPAANPANGGAGP